MNPHVKSICAAIGYTLFFYVGCWSLGSFLDSWNFIYHLALMVLFVVMLPLYFFVRNHMEKRWTLRGALLLSSALLFCVTWAVADCPAEWPTEDSFFAYVCFLESVHIGILLLDLFGEVLRWIARKMQNTLWPLQRFCYKMQNILWPLQRFYYGHSNWNAFFAALLYFFLFYVSLFISYGLEAFLDRVSAPAILNEYAFIVYICLMALLYFSVQRHVERRWLFPVYIFLLQRCAIFLLLLFSRSVSKEITDTFMGSYFVISAFFLFDLFAKLLQEVYRLCRRMMSWIQDRRA